jgi:hypothetical protein
MKSTRFIFIVLISLLAFSCRNADQSTASEPIPVLKQEVAIPDTGSRKLTREADLSFSTADIDATAIVVRQIAKKYKAYIAEENRFEYEVEKGYNISLRVPSNDFDKAMEDFMNKCNIKQLNNKSIRINDVTAEYIDVEARMRVKKESEDHYIELLRQARSLEETLAIESQLSDLRTEIESAEGRLKFLKNQVDYSTIRLSFTEKKGITNRFFSEFRDGLKGGWQVFLKLIIGLSYLWVVIVLFFIGRWGYVRFWRKRQKR